MDTNKEKNVNTNLKTLNYKVIDKLVPINE